MNPELMTQKLQEIFIQAITLCKENLNSELASEHMLHTFLQNKIALASAYWD